MQTIFITGAGGFVGQHAIELLSNRYHILGLLHPKRPLKTKGVTYIDGDIQDQNLIEEIILKNKPSVILHLAAKAATWSTDPKDVLQVNFFGTLNLYQSILKAKLQSSYDPKILFISSAEVYGKSSNPDSINELDPFFPSNLYGVSKVCGDRLSYQYSQTHKLKIVVLRPFNHIGPGQQKGFFVPDMCAQIAEAEKDPQKNDILVGNLESVRDILDVRDVVSAYQKVIESDFSPGEAYNICSGKGVKMSDILETLLSKATKKLTIKKDDTRLRASDIPIHIGNNQKFSSTFNWTPVHPLEKTLKETLDYWRGLT